MFLRMSCRPKWRHLADSDFITDRARSLHFGRDDINIVNLHASGVFLTR